MYFGVWRKMSGKFKYYISKAISIEIDFLKTLFLGCSQEVSKLKVFSGNKAIDSPPFDDKLSQKCFIGSPGSFDRILVLHETISSR